MPNAAVLAARQRRASRSGLDDSRIDWYIENVTDKISLTMEQRMGIVLQYLLTKTKKNISRPVTVSVGPQGGRVVTDRSRPGEFPKLDFGFLNKTLFTDMKKTKNGVDGYLGSPMDYAVSLELTMDRSFMRRTLNEESHRITKILTGPIL